MRVVEAVPEYGPGVGGWRKELVASGNDLAALGVDGVAETLGGSFCEWLLSRARAVDPLLLAGTLPDH